MSKTTILSKLQSELPPIVGRRELFKLTGGVISQRTMANLDSQGKGPKGRVKIGRLTAYERDSFVSWLSERMQDIDID